MSIVGTAELLIRPVTTGFKSELEAQTAPAFGGLKKDAERAGEQAGAGIRTGTKAGAHGLESDLGAMGAAGGVNLRKGVSSETGKLSSDLEREGGRGGEAFSRGAGGGLSKLTSVIGATGLPLGNLRTGLEKSRGAAEGAEGGIGKFAGALGAAGTPALALGAAVGGVVIASAKVGEKMQSADAAIAANAGISVSSAKKIGDAFLSTAGSSEFSGVQMAQAFSKVAGQLKSTEGHALSARESLTFMTAATDLATAKQIDLGTATGALAKVMQAFHISASGAAHASDVLFSASAATGQSIDTLGQQLAKVKSKLGDTGGSIGDLSSLLVDMTNHGITGRGAMGALNTSFTTLQKSAEGVTVAQQTQNTILKQLPPSVAKLAEQYQKGTITSTQFSKATDSLPAGQKALAASFVTAETAISTAETKYKQLGVTVFDGAGKFVGMRSIIEQLAPKFAKMSQEQQLATASTIFGAGAAKQMTAVINGGVGAFDKASAAVNKHAAAQAAAEKQSATLHGEEQKLKVAFVDIAAKIGEAVIPALTSVVHSIGTFITGMEHGTGAGGQFKTFIVNAFNAIRPVAIAVFGGVKTAVTGAFDVFKAVGPVVLGVVNTLGGFKAVIPGIVAGFVAFKVAGALIPIFLGLARAFIAVRDASIAATIAEMENPIGLVAAGIGLLVGAIVTLTGNEHSEASAAKGVADAKRDEAQAIRDAQDAALAAADAQFNAIHAAKNYRQAIADATGALIAYGPKSQQYKDALEAEQEASLQNTEAQKRADQTKQDTVTKNQAQIASIKQTMAADKERAQQAVKTALVEQQGGVQTQASAAAMQRARAAIADYTHQEQLLTGATQLASLQQLQLQRLLSGGDLISGKNAAAVANLINAYNHVPKNVQTKIASFDQPALATIGDLVGRLKGVASLQTITKILADSSNAQDTINQLKALLGTFGQAGIDAGRALGQGLAGGISSAIGDVQAAGAALGAAALASARQAAGPVAVSVFHGSMAHAASYFNPGADKRQANQQINEGQRGIATGSPDQLGRALNDSISPESFQALVDRLSHDHSKALAALGDKLVRVHQAALTLQTDNYTAAAAASATAAKTSADATLDASKVAIDTGIQTAAEAADRAAPTTATRLALGSAKAQTNLDTVTGTQNQLVNAAQANSDTVAAKAQVTTDRVAFQGESAVAKAQAAADKATQHKADAENNVARIKAHAGEIAHETGGRARAEQAKTAHDLRVAERAQTAARKGDTGAAARLAAAQHRADQANAEAGKEGALNQAKAAAQLAAAQADAQRAQATAQAAKDLADATEAANQAAEAAAAAADQAKAAEISKASSVVTTKAQTTADQITDATKVFLDQQAEHGKTGLALVAAQAQTAADVVVQSANAAVDAAQIGVDDAAGGSATAQAQAAAVLAQAQADAKVNEAQAQSVLDKAAAAANASPGGSAGGPPAGSSFNFSIYGNGTLTAAQLFHEVGWALSTGALPVAPAPPTPVAA